MLSFEIVRPSDGAVPDELKVIMDREGLRSLLAQLGFLEKGRTEHVHLMSETWGGGHLADDPVDPNNTSIHHVKIFLRLESQIKEEGSSEERI